MTAVLPDQDETTGVGSRLLELLASIEVHLGNQTEQARKDRHQRLALLNAIYPAEIPPQALQVPSSGTLVIGSAELLGPRSGNVWDVRRISVFGLASTSESVDIYRVSSPTAASAIGLNYISTITGPKGPYSPGLGAMLLRPNQSFMIYGTSLTANEWVTVTADAINVEQPWLGAYLL